MERPFALALAICNFDGCMVDAFGHQFQHLAVKSRQV
jgi:hypothetical protein